jgi:hypothetical protein
MEVNRKYIFERPLAIVVGAFALAVARDKLVGFDVLPMFFAALLGFNLWFTYNRMQSNARIIAYLQVVHTPDGLTRWIGWETALHEFRTLALGIAGDSPESEQQRDNRLPGHRFYGPIFLFHFVAAAAVTGLILAQAYPAGIQLGQLDTAKQIVLALDGIALFGLVAFGWRIRPATVRNTINEARDVWVRILNTRSAATAQTA